MRFTLILRNSDERGAATARIDELTRQTHLLRNAVEQAFDSAQLVGRCAGMQSLVQQIERVAQTDATVLIIGETGTGKELVAQHVHRKSRRRDRPLVCVNCGAIPATLIESEFFGHEKGAFTGATERRIGKFERADGGTLFLDEIGELSLELQAKLLRVLQEGTLERLGGAKTITVDTRVVAATHRDLLGMVREGKFREDLYYRLNVFPISIPPLRERGDDVCLLAEVLLERLGGKMGRRPDALSNEDLQLLKSYHWPGNVRELQNVLERAMIQSKGPKLFLASAMPSRPDDSTATQTVEIAQNILTAGQLKALERSNLQRALAASDGRVFGEQGAARLLGLPPTTVASRMKALKIPRR